MDIIIDGEVLRIDDGGEWLFLINQDVMVKRIICNYVLQSKSGRLYPTQCLSLAIISRKEQVNNNDNLSDIKIIKEEQARINLRVFILNQLNFRQGLSGYRGYFIFVKVFPNLYKLAKDPIPEVPGKMVVDLLIDCIISDRKRLEELERK